MTTVKFGKCFVYIHCVYLLAGRVSSAGLQCIEKGAADVLSTLAKCCKKPEVVNSIPSRS